MSERKCYVVTHVHEECVFVEADSEEEAIKYAKDCDSDDMSEQKCDYYAYEAEEEETANWYASDDVVVLPSKDNPEHPGQLLIGGKP